MKLSELINRINFETKWEDSEKIEIRVISEHWSQIYNSIIDAPVIGVGYDTNHGILYIEINKTGE